MTLCPRTLRTACSIRLTRPRLLLDRAAFFTSRACPATAVPSSAESASRTNPCNEVSRGSSALHYTPRGTHALALTHVDGTISMARDGADSTRSDFFLCVGNQPELDFGGRRNADGQ